MPEHPAADPDQCPSCGNPATARCRCPLGDRVCRLGHEWHSCPGCGARVSGRTSHALSTDDPAHRCRKCRSNPVR